jgi:hypothetical protein
MMYYIDILLGVMYYPGGVEDLVTFDEKKTLNRSSLWLLRGPRRSWAAGALSLWRHSFSGAAAGRANRANSMG